MTLMADEVDDSDMCYEECVEDCYYQSPVVTDPCYSVVMLDRLRERSWKQLVLLRRWCCDPCPERVVLSAQLRASTFYAHASEAGKFAYMGRFPSNFRGDDASVADINDFTIALTYSPLPWLHAYWEFLHSDQITFSTDARQGTNHTQKVYAVIGDLTRTPFYLTIGKKDVSFGAMHTVNPFSPSVTWHYFGALHDGLAIGYSCNGLSVEASALNGGRGIRVADTNEKGKIDNWAVNSSYDFCLQGWQVAVGAGYLNSTIYDGDPPEHTGPISIGARNGAWNVNLHACYCGAETYVEYTSTERPWNSTNHLVQVLSFGVSYDWCVPCLDTVVALSAEHGGGIHGPSGSEFEENAQNVFGIEYRASENARFSFEYVHTRGFAPLMNIAVPGVSSRDARSDVFQLGITLNI